MDARDARMLEESGAAIRSATLVDVWTFPSGHEPDVDLIGYKVEAVDGGIGKVDRVTDEAGGGYVVVDTGPWIFGKKVMLPAGVITSVDHEAEAIQVDRTRDEIKSGPEYVDEREASDDFRRSLGEYYRR